MGDNQSKTTNVLNNFVQDVINLCVNVTQDNSQFLTNSENLTVIGTRGNVNISNIDFSQLATVDIKAVQSAVADAKVQSQLSEMITSAASQVTQALEIKAGDQTETDNVTNLVTELATNVTQAFTQDCLSSVTNNEAILVQNTVGNVTISCINFKQSTQSIIQCVQTAKSVEDAIQKLSEQASSTSSTVEKNVLSFLGDYAILIIIVLIVILLGLTSGVKSFTKPQVILPLMLVVFGGLSVSRFFDRWPYKNMKSEGQKNRVFAIMAMLTILSVMINVAYFHHRHQSTTSYTAAAPAVGAPQPVQYVEMTASPPAQAQTQVPRIEYVVAAPPSPAAPVTPVTPA